MDTVALAFCIILALLGYVSLLGIGYTVFYKEEITVVNHERVMTLLPIFWFLASLLIATLADVGVDELWVLPCVGLVLAVLSGLMIGRGYRTASEITGTPQARRIRANTGENTLYAELA
jgi:hypothetical protein